MFYGQMTVNYVRNPFYNVGLRKVLRNQRRDQCCTYESSLALAINQSEGAINYLAGGRQQNAIDATTNVLHR